MKKYNKIKFPNWLPVEYHKDYKYISIFDSNYSKPQFHFFDQKPKEYFDKDVVLKQICKSDRNDYLDIEKDLGISLDQLHKYKIGYDIYIGHDGDYADITFQLISREQIKNENYESELKKYEENLKVSELEKQDYNKILKIWKKWSEQEKLNTKKSQFYNLQKELQKKGVLT